jgi:hypothetical protein
MLSAITCSVECWSAKNTILFSIKTWVNSRTIFAAVSLQKRRSCGIAEWMDVLHDLVHATCFPAAANGYLSRAIPGNSP